MASRGLSLNTQASRQRFATGRSAGMCLLRNRLKNFDFTVKSLARDAGAPRKMSAPAVDSPDRRMHRLRRLNSLLYQSFPSKPCRRRLGKNKRKNEIPCQKFGRIAMFRLLHVRFRGGKRPQYQKHCRYVFGNQGNYITKQKPALRYNPGSDYRMYKSLYESFAQSPFARVLAGLITHRISGRARSAACDPVRRHALVMSWSGIYINCFLSARVIMTRYTKPRLTSSICVFSVHKSYNNPSRKSPPVNNQINPVIHLPR